MKNIKIRNIGVITIMLAIIIGGCRKGFDEFGDLNENPNTTTVPVTAALLTNTIAGMGNFIFGNSLNTSGALYGQYFAETQYTDQSRYATPTGNWDEYYAGPLYDLQNIINVNTDPETSQAAAVYGSNNNQIAIARILKAYYFLQLTDAFGDIPYFGALQLNGNVAYDPQEEIYDDLFKELTEAVAQFDNGLRVQGDILYEGNTDKWKKFANSIRAVMALRISNVDATRGAAEFNSAITAGVMETNADNAVLKYPGGNFPNPIYNYYNITQRFDYATSKTITDKLKSLNDPRINIFGSSDVGFPYGLSRDEAIAYSNANPNWSLVMDESWSSQTSPVHILTAGQIYLARAEAAQRGWTSENVATNYRNGITLSMNTWGITDATAIANYLAQPAVALSAGTELMKIGEQRWLSHFPDGTQGWAEYRRTGFPALTPAGGATTIPRRYPYGPNEGLYNPENFATASAQYTVGGQANSQFGRVWWDR